MPVEDLTFRAFGEDVSAGRMFKGIDNDADKAKRSVKELDRQISATEAHIRELSLKFAETGDPALLKDVRKAENLAAQLEKIKKNLQPPDNDSIGRLSLLGNVLKGIPGLGPELIAGGVAAAIAAAPAIGAAVGGAVLGGIGTGGIAGALILASRDSRIQDAGKEMGSEFFAGLKDAARPALAPTLQAIQTLKGTTGSLTATLASGFAALSPVIKPLAEGIDGLIRNLGPGLEKTWKAAAPVVRALAHELPELGSAISDALESISDGSDGAVEGLTELLHVVEFFIRFAGEFIGTLEKIFAWEVRSGEAATAWGDQVLGVVRKVTSFFPLIDGPIAYAQNLMQGLNEEDKSLLESLKNAKDPADDFAGAMLNDATSAQQAAEATKKFQDAINNLFGIQMSLDEAQVRYNQGLADLKKELKDGAKTLDITTQAGRDNRKAILDQVQAINDLRQAHINAGMPTERANQLYEQQLADLEKVAVSLGLNRQEVELLVGAYRKIPGEATTTVKTPGLTVSMDQATRLRQELDRLDGRVTNTYVRTYFGEYRAGERNPQGRASGGPTQAGRMYMVGENGPELWMEDANGRMFDANTTKAMLSGASGGGSGPSGGATNIYFHPTGDPIVDYVLKQLKEGVRVEGGGDVSLYFGAIP